MIKKPIFLIMLLIVMVSIITILGLQQIVIAEKDCLENILHLGWEECKIESQPWGV